MKYGNKSKQGHQFYEGGVFKGYFFVVEEGRLKVTTSRPFNFIYVCFFPPKDLDIYLTVS